MSLAVVWGPWLPASETPKSGGAGPSGVICSVLPRVSIVGLQAVQLSLAYRVDELLLGVDAKLAIKGLAVASDCVFGEVEAFRNRRNSSTHGKLLHYHQLALCHAVATCKPFAAHGQLIFTERPDYDQMSSLSQYNGSTSGPFDPTLGYSPEEAMEMTVESGTSVTADTLEELAAAMGVPAGNLVATVERYNELAQGGKDEDFGKDVANLFPIVKPPFYASQITAALLSCASGLNVDGNMNVCSADGGAIEGLYAVGNAAGNFFSNDYPMVCPGISHGRCLTLGYVLGEQLSAKKQSSE